MSWRIVHSIARSRPAVGGWLRALAGIVVVLAVVAPLVEAKAATTSYTTYDAYKASVQRAAFLSSEPHNQRLLTDAQFAGQLSPGTALLGVYYGNQGWKIDQLRDMESWQAKKFAIAHLYTSWCDTPMAIDELFASQLANIWNNRNVPLVSWEPFLCSPARTPANVEVLAAQGRYDGYLTRWFERLRVFLSGDDGIYNSSDDRRVYLRLGHEMNGDWLPWSAAVGNNAPADYIRMWRRVRELAERQGLDASHVQWVWSVNHTDNGAFRAEQYYPGDRYVDWLALSGYNWGETQSWSNWSTPAQVFGDMLGRLRAISSKPLAIPEYASSSVAASGASVATKAQWISSVHEYALAQDVRLLAWFNQDKETDWAVFGGGRGDGSYAGAGTMFVQRGIRRLRPSQIAAATMLVALLIGELVFLTRLRSRATSAG